METIVFGTNFKGRAFEVSINPMNFSKAHKVIELLQNGRHFQYIYQDNISGEYFASEDSKFTPAELQDLYLVLDNQVQLRQNLTE